MKDLPINQIICGDCLEVMPSFPDKSVDMILCDLPYGRTACGWDAIIPFEPLWEEYKRLIKNNGVITLFGMEPFASMLRLKEPTLYRYDIVWDKVKGGGFSRCNKQPLRNHELILIFYQYQPTYNPQTKKKDRRIDTRGWKTDSRGETSHFSSEKIIRKIYTHSFPKSIITFSSRMEECNHPIHPAQKPVALFEYLIRTYTNQGETILDNCIGSGTTAIACINTGRNFVGIEKEEKHFDKAVKRIEKHRKRQKMKLITDAEITKLEERFTRRLL